MRRAALLLLTACGAAEAPPLPPPAHASALLDAAGPVADLAFSDDGAWLLSASEDGAVRAYHRAETGFTLRWELRDESAPELRWGAVAVLGGPESPLALGGGADGDIRIWRLADGAPAGRWTGGRDSALVALTPSVDGRWLAAQHADGGLDVLAMEDGALQPRATLELNDRDRVPVAFEPTGARLAALQREDSYSVALTVTLWDLGSAAGTPWRDVEGGRPLGLNRRGQVWVRGSPNRLVDVWSGAQRELGLKGGVAASRLADDGRWVLGSDHGSWGPNSTNGDPHDLTTRHVTLQLPEAPRTSHAIATPEGAPATFAVATGRTVLVADLPDGPAAHAPPSPDDAEVVRRVHVSDDGAVAAWIDDARRVGRWAARAGPELPTSWSAPSPTDRRTLGLSADGARLALARGDEARLLDIEGDERTVRFEEADGATWMSAGAGGLELLLAPHVWRLNPADEALVATGKHTEMPEACRFGDQIGGGAAEQVWTCSQGFLARRVGQAPRRYPDALTPTLAALDRRARWVAVAQGTGFALYDLDDASIAPRLAQIAEGEVSALALSPDGRRLAVGTAGSVALYSTTPPALVRRARTRVRLPQSLAVAADGCTLVVGGDRRIARLDRPFSGRVERLSLCGPTPEARILHEDYGAVGLTALAASPDGTRLATGAADGAVCLWRGDGVAEGCAAGHEAAVHHLAWSADGAHLVSASAGDLVSWRSAELAMTARWPLPKHTGPLVLPDGTVSHPLASDGMSITGLRAATEAVEVQVASGADRVLQLRGRWHLPWDLSTTRWGLPAEDEPAEDDATLCADRGFGSALAMRGPGTRLACARERLIVIVDRDDPLHRVGLVGHEAPVSAMVWLPDGHLASVAADGDLRTWDSATGAPRTLSRAYDDGRWWSWSSTGGYQGPGLDRVTAVEPPPPIAYGLDYRLQQALFGRWLDLAIAIGVGLVINGGFALAARSRRSD